MSDSQRSGVGKVMSRDRLSQGCGSHSLNSHLDVLLSLRCLSDEVKVVHIQGYF